MMHIIYNPAAGSGKGARCAERIRGMLTARGAAFELYPTRERGDSTRLAEKLTRDGAEDIIVLGGDGSLHEVLNGLYDPSRVRLGLIPCGSGNDFAAAARIPADTEAALRLILEGEARPTDYMVCSGVRGINAIGTGIDVDILRRYARMRLLKGSAAYLASLVLTLFSYKPYVFEALDDDGATAHRAFIACAGNGVSFGGGIPICPRAELDDGLLEVVIVDDIRKWAIPRAFVQLMRRQVLELKTTDYSRRPELRIRSEKPMPLQIDGEIYEDLPFDVRVVSGELRVYRP